MPDMDEGTAREARNALLTGGTDNARAGAAVFARTGFDPYRARKSRSKTTGPGGFFAILLFCLVSLLAVPMYFAARGLWMSEPAFAPHDVDGDALIGFAVFSLACCALLLVLARRFSAMLAFAAIGTVLVMGVLSSGGGWAIAVFLMVELAFLSAWAHFRRNANAAVEGGVGPWKMVRDLVLMVVSVLTLLPFAVNPKGDTASEALADAGRQLVDAVTHGYMVRASDIAAQLDQATGAVALGIPAAMLLLYLPLSAVISMLMRWR